MHYDEEMCADEDIPQDILVQSKELTFNLLPEKSEARYELEYAMFCKWRKNRNVSWAAGGYITQLRYENDDREVAHGDEELIYYYPNTVYTLTLQNFCLDSDKECKDPVKKMMLKADNEVLEKFRVEEEEKTPYWEFLKVRSEDYPLPNTPKAFFKVRQIYNEVEKQKSADGLTLEMKLTESVRTVCAYRIYSFLATGNSLTRFDCNQLEEMTKYLY